MFERGSLVLGRPRGVPLRFHWSVPVVFFLLGRFEWRPFLWLGLLALVVVHELGHAAMIWRHGHRVIAVNVQGLGGACDWRGRSSPRQSAAIAWGGVLAQLGVLGLTCVGLWIWGAPRASWSRGLVEAWTVTNLWIIAFNLIPLPGFDGERAWRFFSAPSKRAPRPEPPTDPRRPTMEALFDEQPDPPRLDLERIVHDNRRALAELEALDLAPVSEAARGESEALMARVERQRLERQGED